MAGETRQLNNNNKLMIVNVSGTSGRGGQLMGWEKEAMGEGKDNGAGG